MRKILLILFGVLMAAQLYAETAGLREYYYFYVRESANDLGVLRVNEAGTVLDGPRTLKSGIDFDGVTAAKNSSGNYILITLEPGGRLRRWFFTPPGTLSGGQTVKGTTIYNFNIDAVENLPGALVGSDEDGDDPAKAVLLASDGLLIGKFYNPIPQYSQVDFAVFRADGTEIIATTDCCNEDLVIVQKLNSSFHAKGDSIIAARLDPFNLEAARMSADGRFAIASSDADGLLLIKLDPVTRKGPTTDSLDPSDGLVHFDSTAINENGTFVVYIDGAGSGTLKFISADGNGHFVGDPHVLNVFGQHLDYADMIRAN